MTDFDSSSLRVSDADRESAMTALGEHMSTGRLTIDEYGDRAARVSTAKTRRDVLELFNDLPQPWPDLTGVNQAAPTAPTVAPQAEPALPVARSRHVAGWAMALAVPVTWLAALAAVLVTGHLAIFLLPFLLTILGAIMLGRGVQRMGRRVIGNVTQATGFTGWREDYRDEARAAQWERQQAHWERHSEHWQRQAVRWQRHAERWGDQVIGQIGAEVQRGMRDAYRRNSGRRRHHGRRRSW